MNDQSSSIQPTVGDIFQTYGAAYRKLHDLPLHIIKAMVAIEKCRTAALGGVKYFCNNDKCNHTVICYKPCGNRHCPKCDFLKKEKWLLARKRNTLPVAYYHVVFTIPDDLNPIALVNQKVVYDILFRAARETLVELCQDPKHMGAQIGIIALLHTWGQNMTDHPHLHCLVPGGGLSNDGKHWIKPKKSTKGKNFFIHVNIVSALFKGKFLAYFKEAYYDGKLKFVGRTSYLNSGHAFQDLVDRLYNKEWVTFCKSPFSGTKKVLEYLGRYAYRVAISNHRIVKVTDDKVTFRWHDYRDNKDKLMTLDVFEFIRRFLLHILPNGYFKIRYYGFLASRNLKTKLVECKKLLAFKENMVEVENLSCIDWREFLYQLTGFDVRKCPKCEIGRLGIAQYIDPVYLHT
jgi:hypothetical protein